MVLAVSRGSSRGFAVICIQKERGGSCILSSDHLTVFSTWGQTRGQRAWEPEHLRGTIHLTQPLEAEKTVGKGGESEGANRRSLTRWRQ